MRRATASPRYETMADILEPLGGISPKRVRMNPLPGTATEQDLLRLHDRTDKLYELIDGTLVEKVIGFGEGFLAGDIIRLLGKYLERHDVGDVGGADATMRIMPGMVRVPDVAFIRWERYPNRERPTEPIPSLYPDLAVEILSKGNTPGEMQRKLKDYFLSGVPLVWFVDPRRRTVEVFTAPDQSTLLDEDQTLDGGDVLPGLRLPVKDIFARVPRQQPKAAKKDTPALKRRRPKQ